MSILAIVFGCALLVALTIRWNSRREAAPVGNGARTDTDGGWSSVYYGDSGSSGDAACGSSDGGGSDGGGAGCDGGGGGE